LGDETQRSALSALQSSPDREARKLLVEQSDRPDTAALLVTMLSDADAAVRLSAAQKLAEQGDGRGIPALRDALNAGGKSSIVAFVSLRRLGESVAPPRDLDRMLHGPDVGDRMQTVEGLGKLPPELAVPFLLDAARDAERLVRRLVAEVAADLPEGPSGPPGLSVLRLLQQDTDAGVRFRAAALIARFGDLSRFRQAAAGKANPGGKDSRDSDGVPRLLRPAAPADPPPAEARDGGTEEPAPAPPPDAGADAGASQVTPSGTDGENTGDRALDAISQLARKGLSAFAAKDFGKAI
jgi:hypothetical protein